ncbi:MAG: hypothetical protein H7A55_20820 [Verrucomicrobiaceae bacterium]|nr:hypothetical protein [Verrucomicrobiaceae bacterium]
MPTLLTSMLEEPLRLRSASNRPRHTDLWRLIFLLAGFCLGWILRTHLIG